MGIYHTNPDLESVLSKPIEEAYRLFTNGSENQEDIKYSSMNCLSRAQKDILGLLVFE